MADDLQREVHSLNNEADGTLNNQGLETDDLPGDSSVNDDILQQALAEASAGTSFDDQEAHSILEEHDENTRVSPHGDGQQIQNEHDQNDDQVHDVNERQVHHDDGTHDASQLDSQGTNDMQFTESASSVTVTKVVPPANTAAAPLGTKSNPIRIIQQGNTYTSMQQLTPEQIQQIVQVLQQQNLSAKGAATGQTVVFNPETNTRIVYRVIYPNDVQKSSGISSGTAAADSSREFRSQFGIGRKRGPKKRRLSDDEEIWSSDDAESFHGDSDSDGEVPSEAIPELTPEEKARKKREKARTRSGRVSKPPSHMVRDYKHIHTVEWYEDYDDSDGGYSDFHVSDEDKKQPTSEALEMSRRKWKCSICDKAYIGRAGLARHFRLMPEHGDADKLMAEVDTEAPPAGQNQSSTAPNNQEETSQDKTQDGSATTVTAEPTQEGGAGDAPLVPSLNDKSMINTPAPVVKRGRGRPPGSRPKQSHDADYSPTPSNASSGQRKPAIKPYTPAHQSNPGRRGRPALDPETRRLRKMEKLTEACAGLQPNDILAAVLPVMPEETTLYDLMVQGLGGFVEGKPNFTRMLQLYTELQGKMSEMAQVCLRQLAEGEIASEGKETIQLAAELVANSLGLEVGMYEVSDVPEPPNSSPEAPNDQHSSVVSPMQAEEAPTSTAQSQLMPQNQQQQQPQQYLQQQQMQQQQQQHLQQHLQQHYIQQQHVQPPQVMLRVTSHGLVTESNVQRQQFLTAPSQLQLGQHALLNTQPTSQIIPVVTSPSKQGQISLQVGDEVQQLLSSEHGGIVQLGGESYIIPEGASIVQTSEGYVIYQNSEGSLQPSDGTTIPLETVQALLAMDSGAQVHFTHSQ